MLQFQLSIGRASSNYRTHFYSHFIDASLDKPYVNMVDEIPDNTYSRILASYILLLTRWSYGVIILKHNRCLNALHYRDGMHKQKE